ncbi:MAG: cytochrome c biogenesis protein CcdA, partial [Pseudomonadota bacterium]
MLEIGVLTAFIGGLISFLSPCVLPLAPPYLAYLGGTTLDQIAPEDEQTEADRELRRRVVVSACFFVLGLGTVFVMLGMGASALGQTMLRYKDTLAIVSG